MIRAGDLPLRIDVQSKTVAYDSYNEPIETWTTTMTISAGKLDEKGSEYRAAQRLVADTEVVFQVRRNSGITVLNRVVYAGRVFEVLHVDDVGFRHFEMRLSCKEVV
jgi:SPP1 family predicted phage head-tail adaptor